MTVRELGRGWMLQTWADHEAMPRLASTKNGAVLVLDAEDDLVIEVEPQSISVTAWGIVVPRATLQELIAATDAYREATGAQPASPQGMGEEGR